MIELHNVSATDAQVKQQLERAWTSVLNRADVGFTRLPEFAAEWAAIDERVRQIGPKTRALVVGIGGSSLGTQVLWEAFKAKSRCDLTFLESPDPDVWAWLKQRPDLDDAHLILISKSGNTLETLSWAERLNAHAPKLFAKDNVTVIASPGEGPLQAWAKSEGRPCLWIPASVGGRFSVLTAVAMLPAGLMGLDVKAFRAGAEWALKRVDLSTQLCAETLASWARGEWITQMWTYSEGMKVFGEWWQQLWSESLGKRLDRAGQRALRASTPLACRGPRDQHSSVQQLIEGVRDKYVFVMRSQSLERAADPFTPKLFPQMPFAGRALSLSQILAAEAEAFELSLKESKIPFCGLRVERLDERSLGALFMLWQMVIAQLGEHMGLNAFDQPGVELGKRHAARLLKQI